MPDHEHPQHARQGSRQRHHDQQRVEPRLEVYRHQQVHKDHREDKPLAHSAERLAHRLALAANLDRRSRRDVLERIYRLLHVRGDSSEVAAFNAAVQIDYRQYVHVRDSERRHRVFDRRDIGHKLSLRVAAAGGSAIAVAGAADKAIDRSLQDFIDRIDHMLRRLHGNAVVDAGVPIEPVVGSHNDAGGERIEQILGSQVLRNSQLQRLGPVDIHSQRGIVESLRYSHINRARDGFDFGEQLDCELVRRIRVRGLETERLSAPTGRS